MIKKFEKDKLTQAVTGSRLLKGMKNTTRGGMPIYKLIGNLFLTKFQNALLGTKFTDSHTGFWAYKMKNFKDKIYVLTTNGFNFDQQLRFQYIYKKHRISEIPIDTKYADERSQLHVKYAIMFFIETTIFFLMKKGFINYKAIKYLSKLKN